MDQGQALNKVKQYKILIKQHFNLDSIYLFGTYAKGTNKPDSKIDIAIVVNTVESDIGSSTSLLWKLRRLIDDRIEPVLIEKNNDECGFLDEIKKHGIEITLD